MKGSRGLYILSHCDNLGLMDFHGRFRARLHDDMMILGAFTSAMAFESIKSRRPFVPRAKDFMENADTHKLKHSNEHREEAVNECNYGDRKHRMKIERG